MRKRFGPRISPVRNRYAVPIRPMIVDLVHDRRTVPTPSGKQYPVLFGAGATSTLMYVALNPAARGPQICEALEITPAAFQRRIERLQDMRLVVGRWRYQINIEVELETELVRFLCAQGVSSGMTRGSSFRCLRVAHRRNKPIPSALPPDLFGTKNRTNILLMVAALNETYLTELHATLGIDKCSLPRRLAEFVVEGVLVMRVVRRVKCYSLNPSLVGADHLKNLLRRWAMRRPDTVRAANMAFLRRIEIERAGTRREREIFREMESVGYAAGAVIHGVQRERPPLRSWRRLHGLWNPWRFARRLRKLRGGEKIIVLRRDNRKYSRETVFADDRS